MKNRIILLIMALSIIFNCVCVNAAEVIEIDEWITQYGAPTPLQQITMQGYVPIDKSVCYAEVTRTETFDGICSMRLYYPREYQQYTYMQVRNTHFTNIADGQYTISFYLKGDYSEENIMVGIGNNKDEANGSYIYLSNPRFTKAEAGGWTHYTVDVDYLVSSGEYFTLMVDGNSAEFYVDEIAVTNENGENILVNGNFDDVEITEVFEDIYYDTRKPRNPMCSPGTGVLALSWENAVETGISKVELYDVTSGRNLIADDLSVGSGALVYYEYAVEDSSKNLIFEIVTSFSDGKVTALQFSRNTALIKVDPISSWASSFRNYSEKPYNVPVTVMLDSTQSHGGNSSLKIMSHVKNKYGNYYLRMSQDVALEIGKTYRLSMWMRGREETKGIKPLYSWVGFPDAANDLYYVPQKSGSFPWSYIERDITVTEDMNQNLFMICIEVTNRELWIDDMELKLVENGLPTGDNVISDGDFEIASNLSTAGEVSEIEVVPGDKNVAISWESPSSNSLSKIRIYDVSTGKESLCGEYDSEAAVINNLENGREYTFLIKTVSNQNIESVGKSITVKPVQPDYSVSEYTIKKGGENVSALTSGVYDISVSVSNNKINVPLDAVLSVVIYNDNELVEIKNVSASINKGESAPPLSTSVVVPETTGGNYRMEIHLWDSLRGLNKLTDKKIIK